MSLTLPVCDAVPRRSRIAIRRARRLKSALHLLGHKETALSCYPIWQQND